MAETLTPVAPAQHAQTKAEAQPAATQHKEVKRQIVSFQFFKILPEWRRLPAEERAAHKLAFAEVIARWNQKDVFATITYSTMGMRGDCDMFLWRICYTVDEINKMTAELLATPLGGYLQTAHSFLAMTKRSQYLIGHEHEGQSDSRGVIRPGGQKYIFVYPFWKTRAWYLLPPEERQRLMAEHIRIGHLYPRVKLNTTYSFGLDDQEFVVAFETNYPEDFLDLVQQLRETEISAYTLKDFPIFTCVRMTPQEMLDRLG
ncbi:MAG TPA: chlorite dismutase family protein [Acidobacteriaceae bacterium]|jgi:chlorite dismutase|nr:chlorite dismutase family protein [Acidobacteriaceae bacterium]